MTLLTLLAPAAPAPPLTGEHGGVAAFEYYRVAAGVTFVAGTDAWATAELVLPVGAPLRAVGVGHAVTALAPLAVARSGTTARARLTGLRGGSGYTAVTPRAAARAGVNAQDGPLQPVKGGVTARAVTATWTVGGLSGPGANIGRVRGGLGGS